MKKAGLKYVGILLLTAAFAAPFLWEWAGSRINPSIAPSSAELPGNPEPGMSPETPDPGNAPVHEESLAQPGDPARKPTAAPLLDEQKPLEPVNEIIAYQDKYIPEDSILREDNEVAEEITEPAPETPEAAEVPSAGQGNVIPPLAIVKAEVPELPDPSASRIISTSVRFVNASETDFSGNLQIKTPRGVRSVSGERIEVRLGGGDTLFVPVVFMTGGWIPAGENQIEFTLKDTYDREVEKSFSRLPVTEKVNLQLTLDQPLLMISNLADSLSLTARVHNRGNTDQWVTVVMAYPVNRGGKAFRELQGWVRAGKDTLLTLRVWPREILWSENVTYVNMSGLYGPEKQVFGSANLAMQSVVSSGRYADNGSDAFLLYDNQYIPQEISLSYRQLGRNAMYQAMGGGHIDLPAGSLSLQGLIYKSAAQNELTALNTLATYRYDNHSLSVGNINEQMEYSTFGRGVKAVFSDKNSRNTLKLGFVDNQFNLLSNRSLFENGYTFFVKDHIGADRAAGLDYMLREDRWEQASHHIAGGEWKRERNRNWNFLLRSHVGVSDYRRRESPVPSGSAEFQYSGQTHNNTLSGNFYYSTAYFPGNRRGTVNLQQNFSRQLKSGSSIRANAFYANFAPRSYQYDMDVENANFRVEGVYTFPTRGNTSMGVGYQQQTETCNLSYLGGSDLLRNTAATYAHRLVEYLNWKAGRHNIYAGLENGMVRNFYSNEWKPQGRANLFYNLGRLSLNSTYQYGGYFLSEQNLAEQAGKTTQRLLVNASWNKELLGDNLNLSAGANYSKDFVVGTTYSASLNSRYRINHQYSVFLNSVVYNYAFHNRISLTDYSRTMYNVEGGVTLNLNQPAPSTGKKSKLSVLVFQDKNGNSLRDADETSAEDYMIMLGNKVFMTDEKGLISYSGLPFGSYTIKAGAQAGWFHNETTFVVGGFREKIEIPLRQAGSVRGSITYRYDERTAKEFVPRLAGITFKVTRNGEPVQRVVTDNDGHFLAFLPNGQYVIEAEALDENTLVVNPTQSFSVESGRMSTLEPFVFQVRNKKINIRQFVQLAP